MGHESETAWLRKTDIELSYVAFQPLPTRPILFKYVSATKADIEAQTRKKEYEE